MLCDSCELLSINGRVCHETGCPKATYRTKCKWCGQEFMQETKGQKFDSTCCASAYNGQECDCEGCADQMPLIAEEI